MVGIGHDSRTNVGSVWRVKQEKLKETLYRCQRFSVLWGPCPPGMFDWVLGSTVSLSMLDIISLFKSCLLSLHFHLANLGRLLSLAGSFPLNNSLSALLSFKGFGCLAQPVSQAQPLGLDGCPVQIHDAWVPSSPGFSPGPRGHAV